MVNSEAEFFISDKKIKLEDEEGNYIFWVAFLNSENEENERSIRTMYGYTELLPGQITADTLISSDGNSYMDFLLNQFRIGNKKTSLEWNMDNDEKLAIKNATFEINDSKGEPVAKIDGETGAAMFGKGSTQFNEDGFACLANGNFIYDSKGNLKVVGLYRSAEFRERIAICEAMILEGKNTVTTQKYNIKIFDYDHARKLFYMIVYYKGKQDRFNYYWNDYKNQIEGYVDFPKDYKDVNNDMKDISTEFGNDCIKVGETTHNNNASLYHIFININYKVN